MIKRYDIYKNSGIEWIGKIPNHWMTSQYKFVAEVQNGFAFKSQLFDKNIGFPILRIRDITSGEISTFYKGEYSDDYIIKKDDLLIGMDGDFNIRWWDKEDILLNQRCCRIVSTSKSIKRFLYYTLPFNLQIINDLTYYTTVKHLSSGDINNAKLPLPSLKEQSQIAHYLDYKTNLIDNIIAQKEQLIEKFKEQRQAIINEAVTKGLDLNAPLTDSGIEWLGKVPKHWFLKRVSYLNESMVSGPFGSSIKKEFYTKTGYKVYGQEQVIKDDFKYGNYYISEEKYNELNRCKISENDILISCVGTFGKISIVPKIFEPGIINPRLLKITPNTNVISPLYFLELLRSQISFNQLDALSRGGVMGVINLSILSQLKFPIPPIAEQEEILIYLNREKISIDKIARLNKKQIKKLKEYRQSIISEVVTGKIDVRDWKPKTA